MKIKIRRNGEHVMEHNGVEAPFVVSQASGQIVGQRLYNLYDVDDEDLAKPLAESLTKETCERIALEHHMKDVDGGSSFGTPAADTPPTTCADAAAEHAFEVGEVVQLKSGGATMTVSAADCCTVECVFMDRWGELKTEDLPLRCLRLADETDDALPF
uniref:DUF2158 domain-containing protein n=1 Tax=Stappia sp. TaxID=1870903 RepID=UPI003BAABDFD